MKKVGMLFGIVHGHVQGSLLKYITKKSELAS